MSDLFAVAAIILGVGALCFAGYVTEIRETGYIMAQAEPILTSPTTVNVHRHAGPTLFAGRRQHWLEGSDSKTGATFEVTAGAGRGSPYITFAVTLADGRKIYEYMDIRELTEARVRAILAEQQ